MKADVRFGIGREEYLLFSLAAVSIREEVIVRAETNQKKALRAVLVRCEDLLFSIELSVGSMGLWYLLFLFFSSHGFSNWRSRLHILGNCFVPIMEYREKNGAWDIFGRGCVLPLLTYASMCIATIICVSRNCFLNTEK